MRQRQLPHSPNLHRRHGSGLPDIDSDLAQFPCSWRETTVLGSSFFEKDKMANQRNCETEHST